MRNLVLAVLLLIFVSCEKSAFVQTEKTEQFSIQDAKELIEVEIERCAIPKLINYKAETKSESFENYEIQWQLYNYKENDEAQIFEVPLNSDYDINISFLSYRNCRLDIDSNNSPLIKSQLIIKRFKETDKVIYFINTMVGYNKNGDSLTYLADKSEFCGYQIFFDTDGCYLPNSYYYENGVVNKMKLYIGDIENENLIVSDIRIALHLCENKTKGRVPVDGIYGICNGCGAFLIDERTCIICGEPVQWPNGGDNGTVGGGSGPCPHCNMSPCICEPCPRCGYDPCVCLGPDEGCQYCYSKECQGECRN